MSKIIDMHLREREKERRRFDLVHGLPFQLDATLLVEL